MIYLYRLLGNFGTRQSYGGSSEPHLPEYVTVILKKLIWFTYSNTFQYPARNHDAADRGLPPVCLLQYHLKTCPPTFTDTEYYNTAIGRALREWNSPEGVLEEVWELIVASSVLCPSCLRVYSVDGLIAHANDDECGRPINNKSPVNVQKLPVCLFLLNQPYLMLMRILVLAASSRCQQQATSH